MSQQINFIQDLVSSTKLRVSVINPGYDYIGDVEVHEGNLALGAFLKILGLNEGSNVLLQTDAKNIYLVKDIGNDTIVIQYLDPEKWEPMVHDPESDIEEYSPDLMSEFIHFNSINFTLEFNNNKLFWWGMPLNKSDTIGEFTYDTFEVNGYFGSAVDSFDEVLYHNFNIKSRTENYLTVDVNRRLSFFNYLNVEPKVLDTFKHDIDDGKTLQEDPDVNAIQFGLIWMIYDSETNRIAVTTE